ncbi:hypothetical protein [Ruminococcus sp.]|uniref:hypothetical protein n=1 Tax=Ruminococcus sp. TaxID=41978 RepID=UPI0025F442C1|nr:hypothetical protein [Ruminococcus sp.]MBR1430448.1 hypothetical protein [Ruminococcus sp.]
MKEIKFFAAVSAAAVIAASMLSGCTDHNDSYIERPHTEAETTTEGIVEWTTKAQTTTKKAKKTTSAADEDSVTTTKKNKNKNKKTTSSEDEYTDTTTTTALFDSDDGTYVEYHFRSKKLLNQHFEKHGSEFDGDFDYASAADYEKGASDVINNSSALHKTEAEDGDGVYYIESTNEFVILSTDGYIRTYFRPNGGIDYYNRQ